MAIPKTMKAALVEKFGAPLVVREVPVPIPGPGQALVEIYREPKAGVRFTFGQDADMLAADTVVRYSADSSASRVQDQNKVALDRQGYK